MKIEKNEDIRTGGVCHICGKLTFNRYFNGWCCKKHLEKVTEELKSHEVRKNGN